MGLIGPILPFSNNNGLGKDEFKGLSLLHRGQLQGNSWNMKWGVPGFLCKQRIMWRLRNGLMFQSVLPYQIQNKKILAFGVAARMVHPATGTCHSVVRSPSEAPNYTSVIAIILKRDYSNCRRACERSIAIMLMQGTNQTFNSSSCSFSLKACVLVQY